MEATDSIIILNENRIPVNKSILAEKCPYFRTKQFQDSSEFEIKCDISFATLKSILAYVYTEKCELSIRNVVPIYSAAIFLLLDNLKVSAFDFMVKHFERILKNESFLSWKLESVEDVLRCDRVRVSGEEKILQFLIKWTNHDFEERSKSAQSLLNNIRFSHLTKSKIMKTCQVEGEFMFVIPQELSLKATAPRQYSKGIYFIGVQWTTTSARKGSNSSKLAPSDICIGRYCPFNGTIKVSLRPFSVDGYLLPPVVYNEKIYFVRAEQILEYDPSTDQCIPISKTPIHLVCNPCDICCCSFNDSIYLFQRVQDGRSSKTHDRSAVYCIETNTWKQLENVPPNISGARAEHAVSCGNCIYLVRENSTNLFRYKPAVEEWTEITCPYDLRAFKVAAYKTKLFFLQLASCGHLIVYDTVTEELKECFCAPGNALYSNIEVYNDHMYLMSRRPATEISNSKKEALSRVYSVKELDPDFIDKSISRVETSQPTPLTLFDVSIDHVVSIE